MCQSRVEGKGPGYQTCVDIPGVSALSKLVRVPLTVGVPTHERRVDCDAGRRLEQRRNETMIEILEGLVDVFKRVHLELS